MGSDRTFRHETMQDAEALLDYLDALTEGLRNGRLTLSARGKEVVLEPKGLIKFDIEAKTRADRRKLTLRFSWREDSESQAPNDPLSIASR